MMYLEHHFGQICLAAIYCLCMKLARSQTVTSKHVNDVANDDLPEIDGPRSLVLLVI